MSAGSEGPGESEESRFSSASNKCSHLISLGPSLCQSELQPFRSQPKSSGSLTLSGALLSLSPEPGPPPFLPSGCKRRESLYVFLRRPSGFHIQPLLIVNLVQSFILSSQSINCSQKALFNTPALIISISHTYVKYLIQCADYCIFFHQYSIPLYLQCTLYNCHLVPRAFHIPPHCSLSSG